MRKLLPYIKAICCSVALLLCLAGCAVPPQTPQQPEATPSTPPQRQSAIAFYLDTVLTLSADGVEQSELADILSHCAEYEAILSKTIEGSDVWRINHANGEPTKVSKHTIAVLNVAQDISARSQGAFDVTIAPASALWDFKSEQPTLPDEQALSDAAALVDYTKLVIEGDMVTLPAGMMIDLGGIAKGYIADEIAALCKSRGIISGLLNFGGNVVTLGVKPDGKPWNVGLQDPDEPTGAYMAAVAVENSSVVTSGIYERGFDLNGVRYHHLLLPSTGWPVQNELASVTILTKSSMLADALSTSCFVLGEEAGKEFLKQFPDTEAIFIHRDRTIRATEGAAALLTLAK